MAKPTMRWLTNTHRDEADAVTARLCAGWIGRRIDQGDPSPTETYGIENLRALGMVGLYHVGADDPVSVAVIMPGCKHV
jgi:hypothetical protein